MNRLFIALVVVSGCGVPDAVTLRIGAPQGYSFERRALTAFDVGEIRLMIEGCRGQFSAEVRAGPGLTLTTANEGETERVVIAKTSSVPMAASTVVEVKRAGRLVGTVRALDAWRSTTSDFEVTLAIDPSE